MAILVCEGSIGIDAWWMPQVGYVELPISANSLFSIPKETLLRPISFAFILLAYDFLLLERQPAEKGLLMCRKK